MTDPGLSTRLRQRSRRAGLMVGISMALSIAICVGVFAAIYAGLTPWLNDLVPIDPPPVTQVASTNQQAAPPASNDESNQPAIAPVVQPEPTSTPEPAAETEPTPTPEGDAFEATHQIRAAGESINLRPEPSTNNNPIRALSPATPLQYLGEESPSNDGTWMRFVTEEGEEGWVRDIDTETYVP
jgi:hypothetical protein